MCVCIFVSCLGQDAAIVPVDETPTQQLFVGDFTETLGEDDVLLGMHARSEVRVNGHGRSCACCTSTCI